jgi:hypothetical protein
MLRVSSFPTNFRIKSSMSGIPALALVNVLALVNKKVKIINEDNWKNFMHVLCRIVVIFILAMKIDSFSDGDSAGPPWLFQGLFYC